MKLENYGFALNDASKALELDKTYIKVCICEVLRVNCSIIIHVHVSMCSWSLRRTLCFKTQAGRLESQLSQSPPMCAVPLYKKCICVTD